MKDISIVYEGSIPDKTHDISIDLTQRELYQLSDLLRTVCEGKYFASYLDVVDMSARDLCILMSAVDTILTMEWEIRCE